MSLSTLLVSALGDPSLVSAEAGAEAASAAIEELLESDPSSPDAAASALALFSAFNNALDSDGVSDVALLADVLGALRKGVLARCPNAGALDAAEATDPSSPLLAAGGRGVCAGSLLAASTGMLRVSSTAMEGGDVVDALGANRSIAANLAVLSRGGRFAYLSTRELHPIVEKFGRLSRRYPRRCLFSYVAPLLNADVPCGLYGVATEKLGCVYAHLLGALYSQRRGSGAAWVVLSSDGAARLHPFAQGLVWKVQCAAGSASTSRVTLEKDVWGALAASSPVASGTDAVLDEAALDASERARAIVNALSPGGDAGADGVVRSVALANAAAMLVITSVASDLLEATELLRAAILEGRALAQLDAFVQRSNMHAVEAGDPHGKPYPQFLLDALTRGSPIHDMRMDSLTPLETPLHLLRRMPPSERTLEVVRNARHAMRAVLSGADDRMVVVVGPCSIHEECVALDYACRLKPLIDQYAEDLLVIMRVYLEKPRSTVGWKGFLYEPTLDGTLDLGAGIERSRKLLLQINSMGIPCATEILDPITPQYYVDLISWGACGARTVESQTHRHMLSGTSMPVGMKNSTSGDISVAANAMVAASQPNTFPTITVKGVSAVARTKGNPDTHIILRGGSSGPNFTAPFIEKAAAACAKHGLRANVVVDCSHSNSGKDYKNQPAVAGAVAAQVAAGDERIVGVMIESHINEGKQNVKNFPNLAYGQSVTDSCVSIETTASMLETLAAAVRARRECESTTERVIRRKSSEDHGAADPSQPLVDMRMESLVPMEPPNRLLTKLPPPVACTQLVRETRLGIRSVLEGADDRMVVVVGPCSIHEESVALDYAGRLKTLIDEHAEDLLVIMRVYLEKPRTTVGWKGFLYEPTPDGTLDLPSGIERSRKLLLQINGMGVAAATEILDPITPQYYVDLISWGACGARTVESQTHRHMLSGTSMPVGMKNSTSGDISVAANAMVAASQPNTFPTITVKGVSAVARTKGNPDTHIILRGGSSGPNFTAPFIEKAAAACAKHGLRANVVVDCSHSNSGKDYKNQPAVAGAVAAQVAAGDERIVGVMIESHINEGKQNVKNFPNLAYGQSVTDSCVSIETTASMLTTLAAAVRARRAKRAAQ